ncbi:MAG: ABC transporter ATP-binding protein [Anaerolineae bacterium]|nr:ABC transporter ATP-binding protein [Anaerolineae bacterium]
MAVIRLEKLRKEFGSLVAVRDITISFPTSTVTCLLGPSGCGKTTLMRMIAGLEEATSGEIYFDDERVTDLSPAKRNIGMVFQYPVVYRGITVYRNIELPLLEEKLGDAERRSRIESVVEILGLKDSLYKDVNEVDNGTRQKVAVARAVARQPRIILFDEPITNVDVSAKVQLTRALKDLSKQHQQTIIYVTHDQTEAMTLADEIALMQNGEIVQRDKPRQLYNHPSDVFGGWFLGNPGMNFIEYAVEPTGSTDRLGAPLFPTPVTVFGLTGQRKVSIGIRPEQVVVSATQTTTSVRGDVLRKSIVVGGQYLLTGQSGARRLKAKVPAEVGQQVSGAAWVCCPLDQITVFDSDGHRLDTKLSVAQAT